MPGPARSRTAARPDALCRALVATAGLDGAAVTARVSPDHGQLMFATDEVARVVEDHHLTLGEGPAIDAFRDLAPVGVPDLSAAAVMRRWPGLTRELLGSDVAALFAYPLQVGEVAFGTVSLYRRVPGALDPAAAATALTSTDALAHAVLRDLYAAPSEPVPRDRVAIATGMVAVQASVPVRNALALLRATAFAEQVSLDTIAEAVVGRTRRFD